MSDTKNVKLGVCKITYDGVDLGLTKGGVDVEVTTATHPVTVDQFGESVINEYITKRDIKIKVPLAETTVQNLAKTMPGATLQGDGGTGNARKYRVVVGHGIGTNLLSIAKELVLHPIELADNDESEDLRVFKAATPGGMKFAYKHDQERVFECEFMGYPENTAGSPFLGKLFMIGDNAISGFTDV